MPNLKSRIKSELDPIEVASREEIQSLQAFTTQKNARACV